MDDPSAHHAYWMKAKMQSCTDYVQSRDRQHEVCDFFFDNDEGREETNVACMLEGLENQEGLQ